MTTTRSSPIRIDGNGITRTPPPSISFDDVDRPPAGTECATCRFRGHYCPAKIYSSEDPEVGICEHCAGHDYCPTYKRMHPDRLADAMEDELTPDPPEVRTIPKEQWLPAEAVKQSTTELEDIVYNRIGKKNHFVSEDLRKRILLEPITVTNLQVADKYHVSAVFVGKLRREAGIITPGMMGIVANRGKKKEKPGMPAKGVNYKTAEREEAKRLLLAGVNVRETAKRSKLTQATVMKVRKEIGLTGHGKGVTLTPPEPVNMTLTQAHTAAKVFFERETIVETEDTHAEEIADAENNHGQPRKEHSFQFTIAAIEEEIAKCEDRLVKLRRCLESCKALDGDQ